MNMSKIQVVVKEPMKKPEIRTIENTLKAKQEIVGGYIEYFPFINGYDIVLNEEGKLEHLPANIVIHHDIVVGTIFISKANERGEDVGLTDEECEEVMNLLQEYTIETEEQARYYNDIIKDMF